MVQLDWNQKKNIINYDNVCVHPVNTQETVKLGKKTDTITLDIIKNPESPIKTRLNLIIEIIIRLNIVKPSKTQ